MKRLLQIVAVVLLAVAVAIVLDGEALRGSVLDGLARIQGVDVPKGDVRARVVATMNFLLTFLALAAVIAIIVAGLFLVLSGGSDTAVQRARKIVIYTVVGLLLIFFARAIVGFFTRELPR